VHTQAGDIAAGRLTPIPYRALTAIALMLILAGCLVGIIVPAGLGWDFACFYDAGRKAWVGQISDLYNTGVPIAGQPAQGQMAFWGMPLSSYFYAPLGALAPTTALVVFKVQNTIALFAALALLFWHTQRLLPDSVAAHERFAAMFAVLALVYQPFWTIYRVGGQTTPTVVLLLVLGLLSHGRSWFVASAACLIAALMIKPSFATILAPLMLVSGTRFCTTAAVLVLLMLGLSVTIMGWDLHLAFLQRLRDGATSSTAWMYNSSLYVTIENLRLLSDPSPTALTRPPVLNLALTLLRLAVTALFVRLYFVARRQPWSRAARLHCYFLLALLFSLLLAPVVWEHYLALLFIPLAYIIASERYFSRPAHWLVALVFVFALGQNLILVNWLSERLTHDSAAALVIVGLLKSAPLLLTVVLLWRHHDELFASYRAPAWSGVRD
jgi:hypothetical protein